MNPLMGLSSPTPFCQFDRKSVDDQSSEKEDVGESLTVPTRPTEADEVRSVTRLGEWFWC